MKHHVVFDTNILRSENFSSPRMKRLKRLIDEDIVKLYVPEIVKNEFLTQKYDTYRSKLRTKDIIDVDRYFMSNQDNIKKKLQDIESTLKEISSNIENTIEKEFNYWVELFKVEVLPFDNSKMTEVMNHYFTGGTVFKSIKNRTDIPDAMICTTIEDLHKEISTVHILNNDNVFKEYLEKKDGIFVYSSIDKFLSKEEISKIEEELDKKHDKFEVLSNYISSDKFIDFLKEEILTKKMNYFYLEMNEVKFVNLSYLAENIYSCHTEIYDFDTLKNIKILKEDITNENQILIGFSFEVESNLIYMVSFDEYMKISNKRNVDYIKMDRHNGDSLLKEKRAIIVKGVFTFNLREEGSEDNFHRNEFIDYGMFDTEIDEVEIKPLINK
ncbi:hypothetical protein CRV02_13375 [Arcobacter sp. CECT 8989]|uniref:PIN domain-containing protein n=1 Tax=Arcobacter sp. CECT 8989 TaxID=2044509 RepID=UPI00100BD60D|nr:PIN domain-containing protein [Arcobacter sp. CECT 8989]RXJ98478.1 hypothetical protein CRV02_13375 [Arcobacter sp. CECT 8989]